jgi:type IV pilus assembly protein PilY1
MPFTTVHTRHVQNGILQLLIACMVWSQPLSAMADPAQQPLVKRGDGSVPPNIFYTIDDSGSMGMYYAPSDNTIWAGENTYNQNIGGFVTPMFHPSDTMRPGFASLGCIVRTPAAAATDSTSLTAMRLRSPDFNKIYYNPAIRYQPWARANPTDADFGNVSFTAAPIDPRKIINSADTGALSGSINLETAFYSNNNNDWCTSNSYQSASRVPLYPSTYYRKNGNGFIQVSLGKNENGTAFFTETSFQASTHSTKSVDRTDCVTVVGKCTLAEERQNFANWYTYYRTRSLLARGASSLAFSKLEDPIRLGYGRINYSGTAADGITGAPTKTVQRGVRDFAVGSATRQAFFDWLYKVPASGGTPLRRAMDDVGRYFALTDSKGPWGNNPGTADTKAQASCRKSFHILMTDGYWNGDAATVAKNNHDGTDGVAMSSPYLNKTYQYKKTAKDGKSTIATYADTKSGTLADVAAYYWLNDLNPSLANNVRSKMANTASDLSKPYFDASTGIDRGDHAFWQHLSTYTVGLGVSGTIPLLTNGTGTVVPPSSGWPTVTEDDPTAVDDLWHAAVNGRGKYLSAQNPKEFQDSMEAALSAILSSIDAKSGVAVSSFAVSSSTRKYVPSFNAPAWVGDVTASLLGDSNDTPIWSASSSLPAPADRSIYYWNGSGVSPFVASQASALNTPMGGASADLINFLRGDRSKEGSTFRCRGDSPGTKQCSDTTSKSGLFGDVINSTPIRVGESVVDYSYQLLPAADTSRSSYRTHLNAKKSRSKSIIVVGANDGMLHFLDDSNGKELFAYIPSTALPNLSRLANRNYGLSTDDANANSHRFFVDGPLTDADAYLGAWTNVVLGTAGAGGKSVFAFKIDTSDPTTVNSTSVMWELNGGSGNAYAANLGYITSPVAVGRMANGKWAAIFGNGLDSSADKAYLWIVDLSTGQAMTPPIKASDDGNNGLGGVSLVLNAQRVVVAAYAGDATGKLWRFDLESETPGNWKVGLGGSPLLNTGKAITAAPTYTNHPKGGMMVLFGTGKLYANGDETTTTTQSLYGVWDVTIPGRASSAGTAANLSQLVKPTVASTPSTGSNTSLTGYAINSADTSWLYTDFKGIRGWSLDMKMASGEREIYNPFIFSGYAYFNTMAPKVETDGDPCISQASNFFLYSVNPFSGTAPPFALYDTNGDGIIDNSDSSLGVIALPKQDMGAVKPVVKERCKGANCVTSPESNCVQGSTGCVNQQTCVAGTPGCNACVKGSPGCSENCLPDSPGCSTRCGGGRATGIAGSNGVLPQCNSSLSVKRTWRQILNFPQ